MKWTTGMLAALVLTMPFAFANEEAVSVFDLRLKQIGEKFDDFVFNVRSALTFDEQAKVRLVKERNTDMKERQKAWLEMKAKVLSEIRNGTLTAEEKKEALTAIRAEHETLVKEHLLLTRSISELRLKAKARGHAAAEREAEDVQVSGLSLGLNISADDEEAEFEAQENLTADMAKALVQKKLGFTAADVRTEVQDGVTYYIVTGNETEAAAPTRLPRASRCVSKLRQAS